MAKTLQEKIAVMQAAAEGKKIEYLHEDGRWLVVANPSWDWACGDYRVKPEPREWYVNLYYDGSSGPLRRTQQEALDSSVSRNKDTIKVREVIEER